MQPNTTLPQTPETGLIRGTIMFTTGFGVTANWWINNTLATLTVSKYATGKYKIEADKPIFIAEDFMYINGITTGWSNMLLSKTTIGDYSYHFEYTSTTRLDFVCQKTSDISYKDFTDIFDGLKIQVEILILFLRQNI